jgi:hypothetical protein
MNSEFISENNSEFHPRHETALTLGEARRPRELTGDAQGSLFDASSSTHSSGIFPRLTIAST